VLGGTLPWLGPAGAGGGRRAAASVVEGRLAQAAVGASVHVAVGTRVRQAPRRVVLLRWQMRVGVPQVPQLLAVVQVP
jgi:hypothetical protein